MRKQDEALDALTRALALWTIGENSPQPAVDAATACLVAGLDNEPLRELAGLPAATGPFETRALLDQVFAELDADYPEMDKSDAIILVLRHYAELCMNGSLSARELSTWAHTNVGHEGPQVTSRIVEMDDDFDLDDLGISRRKVDPKPIITEFLVATTTTELKLRPQISS